MVESFTGGVGIHFLRVVSTGTDNVVSMVASLDDYFIDLGEIEIACVESEADVD